MYAIYAYIDPPNHPNVGIYGIHGAFGVLRVPFYPQRDLEVDLTWMGKPPASHTCPQREHAHPTFTSNPPSLPPGFVDIIPADRFKIPLRPKALGP